jgi:hypothetical protein
MKTAKNNIDNVSIKRVCNCCKDTFYISNENINDAIYYGGKTYHSRCFIQLCNKRVSAKKIDTREKWSLILENIKKIENDSVNHLSDAIDKQKIFEFIREAYDLTTIPSSVWQKIGNIYTGTFRGMSVGISPKHLEDMWKRKIEYLNKIANNNITNGKNMTKEQRINYDLSILVNKYDSYLEWLENQKILEQEMNKDNITNNIVRKTQNINNKNIETDCQDNIIDLVDDIFS